MESKIFKAVATKDCKTLKECLNNDVDRMRILSKDTAGRTVLMVAVENADSECLQVLTSLPELGQLISVSDKKGMNIIHYICVASQKCPQMTPVLVKALQCILSCPESASLFHDKTVDQQQNVLHFAAQQASPDIVKLLVKHRESRKIMKQEDSLKKVPIDYAFNKEIRSQFTH